jgi:hypothetical protein
MQKKEGWISLQRARAVASSSKQRISLRIADSKSLMERLFFRFSEY